MSPCVRADDAAHCYANAMGIVQIDELTDARIRMYRDMKDRELAREGDLFIAQGEHVVRRLLESRYEVHSLLVAQRKLEQISPHVAPEVPIYVLPDELMTRVLGFQFHSGVMACGRRGEVWTVDGLMQASADHRALLMVCPEILNAENLGSLMRVAAAFGVTGMLIGERSCDPFWRRCVRVSMGTVFELPLIHSKNLMSDLSHLQQQWGVQMMATVLADDALLLEQVQRPQRMALLVGSESQGLPPHYVQACQQRVTIPMHLGTDSLNVSVAAAVCLYHFTRVAKAT